MPVYLNDKKLVNRLLAGDEQAFRQFFDENFQRLYRFGLARLSGDEEVALEVVQQAMSRALLNMKGYRGEAALFTWLCSICRNEIADWARKNARYQQHIVLTEDYPDIRAAVDSFTAPGSDGPHRKYQRHEAARLIQVALDHLPSKYGDVLEWKYIEGFSVKEIARRLDLSHQAAQSVLARARRAFQDIYSTLAQPVLNEQ